jgi:acyl-CoA synthetase (AMP-forming)/AMP-acid ligase II
MLKAGAGPQLLRDWIVRAARRNPDKPWIFSADDGRVITYGQLQGLAGQVAAFLRARGIARNERVALLAGNSIEHLACYVSVMAYGATVCTIHVEMNRRYLDNIVSMLEPRLVLFEEGAGLDDLIAAASAPCLALGSWDDQRGDSFFAAVSRREPEDAFFGTSPGDDAVILYTSGTSAWPKGVVLSFRELLSNAEPTAAGFGMTSQDRIYDFRSFNWCSAQTLSALPPLCRGASLVLAQKFSRSRFFADIRRHGATIAAGNPTTLGMLLNGDDLAPDVPTLRFVTSSSAPLPVEDWRRFEERFGVRVTQGYGSSETGWIAAHPGEHRRLGTVGMPLRYHQVRVVDGEGQPLKPGEIGPVELGGFADNDYRYLADDGSIRVNSRGRMRTGDLGFLDEEGYLHLTGREKEIIIRGGINISPVEIDSLLMQRPDLLEVATVGVPDAIYGEEVVSYVVARAGAAVDTDELLRYCSTVMPTFKAPKQIVLSDQLPKTERGKLDRKALAERWSRSGDAAKPPKP